jgi:uncharacterized damage-inducible protein DinB
MENAKVAEFVSWFDRIRERTMRVARCVPPGRIDWTYKEGKFTFGDLMRHLAAIERWMFAENAQRQPSMYPGHGRELADGFDGVILYMERMHAESMAIFRSLTDDALEMKCMTPGRVELRVSKWLRSMVEHEVHHRGQIYMMLSMIDVPTPPIYGLTEEEVKRRSTG